MLQAIITNFLNECKHYHFSEKAIYAFFTRLDERERFLELHKIESVNQITYRHLLEFVTSGGDRSRHIKKVRKALEKLPAVVYENSKERTMTVELIESHHPKRHRKKT